MDELRAILTTIASRCRAALEKTLPAERDVRLRDFPLGTCDIAELIGRVIFETTGELGSYVCGQQHPEWDPQQSHAWLEIHDLVASADR